jgi:glycosyltransferase involved in cell wall biosynthesis
MVSGMIENNERPLVTFALFAYNQEQYIREAVEAALAQDYTPLEIIISDDCSTDRTFSVIKETVAAYEGPHRVIARQTAKNCGSLLHVADVAKSASGKLLVAAAGDDVSKKLRTSTLVKAWIETKPWGLCSRYDPIDELGGIKALSVAAPVLKGDAFKRYLYEAEGPIPIVHGCTSAYDMQVFQYLQLDSDDYILAEDGALTVLINLLGQKIAHLDESLILYRECEGSLTNSLRKKRPSLADLLLDERRIERLAKAQANRFRLFLRMNDYLGSHQVRRLRVNNVRQEMATQDAKANWWGFSFGERVTFIAKHPGSKWALARSFGFRSFLWAKWLYRRLSFTRNDQGP